MPLSEEILRRFAARVFVETGSYLGDGVQAALDAGFERVVTIEADRASWERVRARFADDPRVTTILGDSADLLAAAVDDVREPAVFWLDAHWSGDGTGGRPPIRDSCVYSPVIDELEVIGAHPVKGHTVLIDDVRVFRDGVFVDAAEEVITPVRLMGALLDIDDRYEFELLDGAEARDVLAAWVP